MRHCNVAILGIGDANHTHICEALGKKLSMFNPCADMYASHSDSNKTTIWQFSSETGLRTALSMNTQFICVVLVCKAPEYDLDSLKRISDTIEFLSLVILTESDLSPTTDEDLRWLNKQKNIYHVLTFKKDDDITEKDILEYISDQNLGLSILRNFAASRNPYTHKRIEESKSEGDIN